MEETTIHDYPSLFSLKGKVVVVTGGSRGLGLNAASAVLQAGAATVFISSRKPAACEAACEALNALPRLAPGARAVACPADVSTVAGVRSLVAQVRGHGADRVHVLLANAGATWGEPFDTHPDAAVAKVLDLNVRAVFNTIREFAPLLEAAGTGSDPSRVIITSSSAGLIPGPPNTYGYSASKAAVTHLGRALAVDLGPRHITVNSICPGFFPTRMTSGMLRVAGVEASLAAANPVGRLGRSEDIAGAVVYLASRAGAYVNGVALVIDGGMMWTRAERVLMSAAAAAKL